MRGTLMKMSRREGGDHRRAPEGDWMGLREED
jgi:hypothetical protein